MGFLKEIKKLGQGVINVVKSPFNSAVNSLGKSAAEGASKTFFEKLAELGVDQVFINTNVVPALEGVTSIGDLAKTITPWINPVATSGIALSYTVIGYLILRTALSFYNSWSKSELDNEMLQSVQNIEKFLESLEKSSQFQTVIQLQQLAVQHHISRQEAARTIQKLRPAKLRNINKDDKKRLEIALSEAREILDKPKPIILSDEIINAMNVMMEPYLRGLFAIPKTITTTEGLLDAVSSNMDFQSAVDAFIKQDFSKMRLTLKDAMNFNYLNKISEGIIGKIVSETEEKFTNVIGNTLASAACFEWEYSLRGIFHSRAGFYRFNNAIAKAQQLAISNNNLIAPLYKYNVSGSVTILAIQYQKIKKELLSDKDFVDYLNCSNDQVLIEQVTMVILNRALLGMAVNLSKRYDSSNAFKDGFAMGFVVGLAAPLGPFAAGGLAVGGTAVVRPTIRHNIRFRAGQISDGISYVSSMFFKPTSGVKRQRDEEAPEETHSVCKKIKCE